MAVRKLHEKAGMSMEVLELYMRPGVGRTPGLCLSWPSSLHIGPNPTLTLLANPLPRGDQRRKGGDVGFRGLGMGEPGHDTFEIDADRNQDVLEMGFGQANVA